MKYNNKQEHAHKKSPKYLKRHKEAAAVRRRRGQTQGKYSAEIVSEPRSLKHYQPIMKTSDIVRKLQRSTLIFGHYYLRLLPFLLPTVVNSFEWQTNACDSPDGVDDNCKNPGGQMYYFITCTLFFAGMHLNPYVRETQCRTYYQDPQFVNSLDYDTCHNKHPNADCTCLGGSPLNPRLIHNSMLNSVVQALRPLDPDATCSFFQQAANLNDVTYSRSFFEDKKVFSHCFTNFLLNGLFGIFRAPHTFMQSGFKKQIPSANVTALILNTMEGALSEPHAVIKEHADKCLDAGYFVFGSVSVSLILASLAGIALICCIISCCPCGCAAPHIIYKDDMRNSEIAPIVEWDLFTRPRDCINASINIANSAFDFLRTRTQSIQNLFRPIKKELDYEPIPDGPLNEKSWLNPQ